MINPLNLNMFSEFMKDAVFIGNGNLNFSKIKTSDEADEGSLTWINPARLDKLDIFNRTQASIVICSINEDFVPKKNQALVKVPNPKWTFIKILASISKSNIEWGIHPSTQIHSEAVIESPVSIGPNCTLGKCTIGSNVVIKGNVYIGDGTIVGNNVLIHPGAVIGADGFGYSREDNGTLIKFPHIGGVLIEDDVEIGANTCVDRGALGNTKILRGAKIDNLVHVAHNVVVGRNVTVIANAMLGGSVTIGDNSWISPSATIRDTIKIGERCTVGMASLVTKDIPNGQTVAGSPARELSKFLLFQDKLKNLLGGEN